MQTAVGEQTPTDGSAPVWHRSGIGAPAVVKVQQQETGSRNKLCLEECATRLWIRKQDDEVVFEWAGGGGRGGHVCSDVLWL